ncbi:MAG: tRNA 2-thiouridine(34) synthase MnmA [PVC group bacterium]
MKIGVALSGGKDSSLAAALLLGEGHQVTGFHLLLCPDEYAPIPPENQLAAVRRLCGMLGIGLRVIDARADFRREIMEPFVAAYRAGKTPNPCVLCNRIFKFGRLFQAALEDGCDLLASGHYARVTGGERPQLKKPLDPRKDESYFLFDLPPGRLSRLFFPLGELALEEIRKISRELLPEFIPLPVTQEACFLSRPGLRRFLEEYIPRPEEPGEIIDQAGKVLGGHPGCHYYTVGQRRGLSSASGRKGPLYVLRVIPDTNQVVVGEKADLRSSRLRATGPNWLSIPPPAGPLTAVTKIRYTHPGAEALITPQPDNTLEIEFAVPQEAPAPGQAAVFYRDNTLLGGAWIEEVF